ncbi:MAG: DNA polymerase I, partial [Ruthenibacterium sp.]
AGVYENLDDARVKPGVREKLLRDKAQAQMSRTLAEIVRDAPVDTAPGAYAQGASDGAAAAKLMRRLEMYGLVKKLGLDDAAGTGNFAGGAAAADGSAGAKSVSGKGSAAAKRRAAQADPDNGQLSFDDAFGAPASEPGTGGENANGTGGSDGAAGADKAPASERQDTNALAFAVPADTAQPDTVPLPALSGPVYLCTPDAVSSADESELLADGVTILIVQNDTVYTAGISSEALLSLLENENVEKRCFNAKPLYRAAFAAHRTVQNLTFDAKLAAYLLQPDARSYTVTRLAESYGVAPAFASPYAEAGVLAALCDTLAQECDDAGMGNLLREIELPLCEVLASMEHEGILVDKAGIAAFGRELQSALTAELAAICEGVGYEFNVNSPKQLGKALFEALGLPTRKKTKSGYSTNAETLESLREYSPVIDHILQYRTYQKLNSTYVEGLLKVIGADGRIHSTFNQTETRTGRISSGEPNLQNIPVRTELGSRFRKYFVAPGGCTLLDADYSQIELRILAHIADDAVMQETFRAGDDIHRSTAAKIYGVSETDVTPQMRSSAKAVNFGIVYGIGAFSLAKDINVSVKEADAFIKSYLSKFPNVKRYMDDTVATARENGCVTTLYGRRRMLPELANSNFNIRALGERMAMNTPIQGTAADIIKLAMVRVYRRLAAENLNAKLILQVHDELIVECPQSERARAAAILGEEMQGAAQLRVPLVADVNSGDSWYDAKG